MGNLVFQATLGGQVNLVGPNTASTYNLNVPAVAGTLVTTGDTATVTNTMISGPVSIAKGGTNQTAFTSPAASVNGLVWFDGTSFQNDTSPAHVGYNASTNTFNALNILSPNDASISGLTVGKGAGSVSTNTAVGASALAANTTGTTSTAVGGGALATQTTANYNTAFGYNALNLNNGDENTAVGVTPLALNTTGTNNNAFGNNTLGANTTGSYNTAFGKNALRSNTTASYNTAVGYQAGYTDSTGGVNTFLGYYAGYSTTSGNNTFVGANSGYNITSGAKNTILGAYSGNQGGLDIRTDSNNVVLSDGDGNPRLRIPSNGDTQLFATGSNFSLRNSNAAGTTNAFLTGLYSATDIINGGTVSLRLWTNGNIQNTNNSYGALSDIKLKENIEDATPKLDQLCQVRVVNYNFKEGQTHKQIGVIAQELEQVFPSMIDETPDVDEEGNDLGTTTKAVKYSVFVPMLVKAIQELKADLDAQKIELNATKAQLTNVSEELAALKAPQ